MNSRSAGSFLCAILATLAASPLLAQTNAEIVQRLTENNEALRRYSWTMRVEVNHEAETMVGLYKMRYDIDGNRQATAMSSGTPAPADVEAGIRALGQFAMSYAQPGAYAFQGYLEAAAVWEGRGPTAGTLRVEGEDLHRAGDFVTITAREGRPQTMDVKTTFNGQPTEIRAEYRALPQDGPTYVARMTVSYPSLQIQVENFDYVTDAAPPASTATLPQGTELRVRATQPLSTRENLTGQTFTAILEDDVGVGGRPLLPKGARVVGRLVEVRRSGRSSGRAMMTLTLTSVYLEDGPVAVQTQPLTIEAESTAGRDARRVGGLTGLGAIIGGIANGGEGAAAGAVIGATAGAVATLSTRGEEVEFPAEQLFVFPLAVPVELPAR
jgi:hypothetical protein